MEKAIERKLAEYTASQAADLARKGCLAPNRFATLVAPATDIEKTIEICTNLEKHNKIKLYVQ